MTDREAIAKYVVKVVNERPAHLSSITYLWGRVRKDLAADIARSTFASLLHDMDAKDRLKRRAVWVRTKLTWHFGVLP